MEQTFDELKKIVDDYYKNDLKRLEKYFEKFRYANEKDNFAEVCSELYLHTIENLEKIAPIIIKNQYHYYCTKYIFNQRMWKNTQYKKNTIIKENGSEEIGELPILSDNDFEAEEELLRNEMEFEVKLAKIKIIYDKLPLHEKILFDKYYHRGLSMRKIAKETGVTTPAIFYMISKIRGKIQKLKL
jgi:hypothetical protein